MSKTRGCTIVEATPGQWYCITADDEDDYDFENATTTGPFPNEDAASAGHAGSNPGYSNTVAFANLTAYERELLQRFPVLPKETYQ